jgi:phage-related protein
VDHHPKKKFDEFIATLTPMLEKLIPIIEKIGSVVEGALGFTLTQIMRIIESVGGVAESLFSVFAEIGKVIFDTFGAAWSAVEPFLSGLGGGFEGAVGEITGFLDRIAEGIAGLTPFIQEVGGVIQSAFVWAFSALGPIITKALEVIGPLLAIAESLGKVFLSIGATIWNAIQPIFGALGENADTAKNGITTLLDLVIKGVRLVSPAIETVGKILNFIVKILMGMLVPAITLFINIAGGIGRIVTPIIDFLGNALIGIAGGVIKAVDAFTGIGSAVSQAWDTFKATLGFLPEALGKAWETFKQTLALIPEALGIAWNTFSKGLSALGEGIASSFSAVGKVFKNFGSALGNSAKTALKGFSALGEVLFGPLIKGVKKFIAWFAGVFPSIKNTIKKILDSAKNIFLSVWEGIKAIVLAVIDGIKAGWDNFSAFISGLWEGIKTLASTIWEGIKAVFFWVIDAITSSWQAFSDFIALLWEGIKSVASTIWEGIKAVVLTAVEWIQSAWQGFSDFLALLWEGIKALAEGLWNGILSIVTGVIEGIKNIWNGLIEFFTGLWTALQESPTAAVEFIKNTFLGLFDGIKEKFFGFIEGIKEGWEKVKGFFGGLVEGAVNLVTGGGNSAAQEPKKVNDLIVTPEGQYSTHPDDYIMAMKNPASLVDSLSRFLGQGSSEPAYPAGGGSLVNAAMNGAAQQNTYNNSTSNVSTVSAPVSVNVNASGMSPEQAQFAVERGVRDALRSVISGSRGSLYIMEAGAH